GTMAEKKDGAKGEKFDAFVAGSALTPEQQMFLRKGLKSRAVRDFFDANAAPYAKPARATGSTSRALETKARKSGLVRELGRYAQVQHSGTGPHVVSAPIYVEGAEPGDVLAVSILKVTPRVPYGVNTSRMGKGTLPADFPQTRSIVTPFDIKKGIVHFAPGI